MSALLFYILGFIMLAATLLCITRRNPVHAVIYLVVSFFALAIMFYLLGAPLVAAFEVIVYAGAIMVLFLFVIMLLGAERLQSMWSDRPTELVFAAFLGFLLVATFLIALVMESKTAVSTAHRKSFDSAVAKRSA